MADGFTKVALPAVQDAAVANGWSHRWQARFAREPLHAAETGVTHFRLLAGRRSPFMHRHREPEEVYVILAGGGSMKLGDEVVPVGPLDAIRVAAQIPRGFEAGPDGLEFIAFGRHVAGDGEAVEDPWVD